MNVLRREAFFVFKFFKSYHKIKYVFGRKKNKYYIPPDPVNFYAKSIWLKTL